MVETMPIEALLIEAFAVVATHRFHRATKVQTQNGGSYAGVIWVEFVNSDPYENLPVSLLILQKSAWSSETLRPKV
jgi:hypothetical protein